MVAAVQQAMAKCQHGGVCQIILFGNQLSPEGSSPVAALHSSFRSMGIALLTLWAYWMNMKRHFCKLTFKGVILHDFDKHQNPLWKPFEERIHYPHMLSTLKRLLALGDGLFDPSGLKKAVSPIVLTSCTMQDWNGNVVLVKRNLDSVYNSGLPAGVYLEINHHKYSKEFIETLIGRKLPAITMKGPLLEYCLVVSHKQLRQKEATHKVQVKSLVRCRSVANKNPNRLKP